MQLCGFSLKFEECTKLYGTKMISLLALTQVKGKILSVTPVLKQRLALSL